MAQPLHVEVAELRAKSSEIGAGLPTAPAGQVAPPCALPVAQAAAGALNAAADTLSEYLAAGEAEQKRLAQALDHAATAYEQTDHDGKEALDGGTPVSGLAMPAAVTLPAITPRVHAPKTGAVDEYDGGVEQAAKDIAAPDQAIALGNFLQAWHAHAAALSDHCEGLQPCTRWEGDAADGAKTAFGKHKEWLSQMSECCHKLSAQAQNVAAAHREAVAEHPAPGEVAQLKKAYIWAAQNGDTPVQAQAMTGLATLQRQSEYVLSRYASKAHVEQPRPELPPGTPDPQPVPYGGVQAVGHWKQGPPMPADPNNMTQEQALAAYDALKSDLASYRDRCLQRPFALPQEQAAFDACVADMGALNERKAALEARLRELGVQIDEPANAHPPPEATGDATPFPPPREITGLTKHGAEQVSARDGGHGVNDSALRDAVTHPIGPPKFKPDQYGGRYQYVGKDATVVLNKDGQVVTAWANSRDGWRNP